MSILQRIAIGNALVIVAGAVGGTIVTLHLAGRTTGVWLVLLFATTGIALSLLVNGLVVRRALQPLRDLRRQVDGLDPGNVAIGADLLRAGDIDIRRLSQSVDAMARALAERNLQLRALSERSIAAQEAERKRIARSLHDDTIQALSTLAVRLERLEKRAPEEEAGLRSELGAIRGLATESLRELRHIVYGLRPSLLDDLGLVAAIRSYARSVLEPQGIRVEVDGPEQDLQLPGELGINLYRIAQEAVSNIARHSGARSARVSVAEDGACVRLEVRDDGHGFDVAESERRALELQHLGLLGMRERAQLFGGEVHVASGADRGTRIVVSFPLEDRGASFHPDDPTPPR